MTTINKVVYGQTTLLDLTSDTVTASHLDSGYTAHDANGAPITGTVPNRGSVNGEISTKAGIYTIPEGYHDGTGTVSIDSGEQDKIIPENIKNGVSILGVTGSYSGSGGGGTDTSDATASAGDILADKTAYISSGKVTGTMANNGAVSGTIDTVAGSYAVPAGYHNGNGSVSIDPAEHAKLIASNIKSGVSILGVAGTLNAAAVEPYGYDFRKGWVGSGVWTYQVPTDTLVDIYWVIAGHEYWLTLGASVGTRFRVMFTTVDVTTITSGKVTGTNVKNVDSPASFANFSYTPSSDGYLIIGKDNVGVTGLKTYLYDKTAAWL